MPRIAREKASDIPGYEKYPEKHQFSSLGIYLGLARDSFEIVSLGFMLGILSGDKDAWANGMPAIYIFIIDFLIKKCIIIYCKFSKPKLLFYNNVD